MVEIKLGGISQMPYWYDEGAHLQPYASPPNPLGSILGGYQPTPMVPAAEAEKLKKRVRELEIQLAERDEIIEALVADLEALQEKTPEMDKEGWIKWVAPVLASGEAAACPLAGSARIEVMLRYYKEIPMRNVDRADAYSWEECGKATITAYRYV